MTSGPITLPAIRHREKKAPVKKEPVAMDLEAIRLRRERLAALTTAKRTGGAADLSAARTRPPAAPSSASKIRKKHHGDPQPDSGKSKKTVKLMPIGNRRSDPQGNELDRQRAADPLLKKPSLKKPESKKASPKTNSKENKPVKKVSIQAKKKPPKAVIDRKEFITPAIHDMRAFSDDRRFDYREPAEYYDPKPYDDLPEEELVLPSYPLEEPAEEVEVPGEEPEPEEEPLKEQEEQAKVEPPNLEKEEYDDDPEMKMKLERRTAMRLLNSLEEKDQLEGATTARRHLSVSVDPPIAEYINANAVPLLISLLNKHHNPQLQFEALWALTNIASGSSDQTRTVVEAGGLPPIARLLASADPEIVDQAVWAIGNIAGDGPAMRDAVLRVRIVPLLDDAKKKLSSTAAHRNMAWTISNIVRPKPCQMSDDDWKKCLLMLRGYLRSSDPSVKLDAAWGLSYVSDGNSEAIQRVLDLNILKDVAEMLTSTDEKISKVSLRIAGNVVSGNDEQTDKVIAAGILPCLLDILRPENKKSSSERREAAWALSNITAGSNEQIQKVFDSGAVPILVQTMKDGTTPYAVCKEVVWCLGNSTNGDPDQIDFLVSNGVVQVFINFLTEHSDIAGPLFPVVLNFISNILEQATDVETLRRELQEHEEDLNNILDAAELRDVAPQLREKLDEFLNDVSPEEE